MVHRGNNFNLSALLAVALVLTLLIQLLADAQTVKKFPFIHQTKVGDIDAFNTVNIYAGLRAAAKYVNDNNLIQEGSVQLDITFIEGAESKTVTPVVAAALVGRILAAGPVFGFINPDYYSSGVLFAVPNFATVYPILNPLTTAVATYTSAYPNWMFLRPSTLDEAQLVVQHAVHSNAMCTSFMLMWVPLPGITDILASLQAGVIAMGFNPARSIQVSANMSAVVEAWFLYPDNVPTCGVIAAGSAVVQGIMESLYADPRYDRANTYLYSSSAGALPKFNSTVFGVAPFVNGRLVQVVNDPQDRTIASAAIYQDAMTAWIASNEALPANMIASNQTVDPTPNSVAYEGFLTGMLLASMLDAGNLTNVTTFINSVYKRRFFFVKETVFGPYNRDAITTQGSLVSFPSYCNVGARSVFMQSIANATTTLIRDNASRGESGVASVTATLQTCRIQSTTQVPLRIATTVGSNSTAMETLLYFGNQQAAMTARFAIADKVPASNNISASFFPTLQARYKPIAYVGQVGAGSSPASVGILTLQTNSPFLLEDPPLKADPNASLIIRVDPVVSDFIISLSGYLSTLSGIGAVDVITDVARLSELTVLSLNTYLFVPSTLSSEGTSGVAAAVNTLFARAEGGVQAVLFVAASTQAMVHDVLAAVSTASGSASAGARSRAIVALACDPSLVYTEVLAGTTAAIPSTVSIVFASHVVSPWLASSPTNLILNQSTVADRVNYNTIRGILVGSGLVQSALLMRAASGKTSADLMSAIYQNGQISAAEITIGPLYKDTCSAAVIQSQATDRTCQCTKGPRKFNVYSMHDVGTTGSATVSYTHTESGCGPTYKPLPPKPTDNTTLILAIAIPVGVALLGLIILAFCCCAPAGRDNRSAPKESEEPFAMVFTDIQSSTSLWARAPQQMSESVERHHDEIRKLVRKYNGYEVKTIGDSFMVAFKKANDAIKFALAIQTTFYHLKWPTEIDQTYQELILEALEEMNTATNIGNSVNPTLPFANYEKNWNGIRVRVGLHWGVGSVKLDPVSLGYDYYGTLVNTAARVEGVGNGGQVLVTKEMYDELDRCQFDFGSVDLLNMGPQPLRGLDNPVVLYQLNPTELAGRQFNALRLDKEVDVAEEASEQSETMTSGTNSVAGGVVTAEAVVQRVMRAKGPTPQSVVDLMVRFHAFLDTMFSTSPAAFRKDTLKQLGKTWRISMKRDTSDAAKLNNEVQLTCQIANTMGASKKYRHLVGGANDRRMSTASNMFAASTMSNDVASFVKPMTPLM